MRLNRRTVHNIISRFRTSSPPARICRFLVEIFYTPTTAQASLGPAFAQETTRRRPALPALGEVTYSKDRSFHVTARLSRCVGCVEDLLFLEQYLPQIASAVFLYSTYLNRAASIKDDW